MKNTDEYISTFPPATQKILTKIRETIQQNAPGAIEEMAYKMPAFKMYGRRLVYFAAYKKHIGFYAHDSAHTAFEKELKKYKHGRGSVQFPLDQPVPYDLIAQMVQFRVEENKEKAKK